MTSTNDLFNSFMSSFKPNVQEEINKLRWQKENMNEEEELKPINITKNTEGDKKKLLKQSFIMNSNDQDTDDDPDHEYSDKPFSFI